MKQRKGWRMSCDVGKATEGLGNELWRRWSDGNVGEWALLILQRHNSFPNTSVALPTSQFILQPFFSFSYVTVHSPTLLSLLLCHRAHSPTFPLLHLRHNSFSNPSVALPRSQLILQPLHCFTYVTAHSPTLLSFLLRHRLFTYITWRAAHVVSPNVLDTSH